MNYHLLYTFRTAAKLVRFLLGFASLTQLYSIDTWTLLYGRTINYNWIYIVVFY